MHADSDVDRYAKLDQALLQERSGQVVPEFNPSVAIARTAAELLKEDIAFALSGEWPARGRLTSGGGRLSPAGQ